MQVSQYSDSHHDNSGVYAGDTGHSFKTRLNEFMRPIKQKKDTSTYAQHMMNTEHKQLEGVDMNNTEILHLLYTSK
jgi:hypothetical protein